METTMIRTLLTSTALVALLATGALAQNNTAAPADNAAASSQTAGPSDLLNKGYEIVDTDGLASKLIGFPVYSSSANDAEKIGEINDLVINEGGDVSAVLIGVGGFLGVGEKNVAVDYNDLQWTTAEDNTERLVLETTKEALNAAPAVETRDDEPTDTAAATPAPADNNADQTQTAQNSADNPAANAPASSDQTQTAEAPADNNSMAAQPADQQQTAQATDDANGNGQDDQLETGSTNQQAAAPADQTAQPTAVQPFNPEGQTAIDVSTLTADDLKGTNVYGPDNQHIGTIGDFVLGEDGKTIDAVIVDFGGFLGIGTKPVALAYDKLPFYVDANGNRSLVINVTREQMDQAPAFNKDTYAAERDSQRLVIDGAA
jgi:sporulation protein YlmC with PRC-barrel domain